MKCPKCEHEFEYDEEVPEFTKEVFEDSIRHQNASLEFMKNLNMFSGYNKARIAHLKHGTFAYIESKKVNNE